MTKVAGDRVGSGEVFRTCSCYRFLAASTDPSHKVERANLFTRMSEQVCHVVQSLRIFQEPGLAFEGNSPIVAFDAEDCGGRGERYLLGSGRRRWSIRFDPLNPSLACAASTVDFDRRVEFLMRPTVLAGRIQRPAPVVQRLGFLERELDIAEKSLPIFRTALRRLGISLQPRDYRLRPHDEARKPAPILARGHDFAAPCDM